VKSPFRAPAAPFREGDHAEARDGATGRRYKVAQCAQVAFENVYSHGQKVGARRFFLLQRRRPARRPPAASSVRPPPRRRGSRRATRIDQWHATPPASRANKRDATSDNATSPAARETARGQQRRRRQEKVEREEAREQKRALSTVRPSERLPFTVARNPTRRQPAPARSTP